MIKNPVAEAPLARTAASRLLPTLVVLFFLSGLCGLIYQVLWLRLLALVFGVTVYAASTVLASFMGGLALGSFVAGRLVDRARRPLLWYGVAEILVGLSALATPALLGAVERLYVTLYPSLSGTLPLLTLVRFVFSFLVLLVPTTLMGATLPIVIKGSLLQSRGLGERVGLLYGTNTAGAILGTLLAGFVLIGQLGISVSFLLAAALNLLVGVAAAIASSLFEREPDPNQEVGRRSAEELAPSALDGSDIAVPERARRVVLLVFALSGFTSLALEVIWFRMLTLFLDVTTYAFTIMLATVLSGIALGSYLVTPLMRRRRDWMTLLAILEVALAVISVLSLVALARSYGVFGRLQALTQYSLANLFPPIVCFLAIFPATLLLGIAFPIGLHVWAAGGAGAKEHTGKRTGLFYSLNLLGAILGSIAGGFLLLPWLGSRGSLLAVAGVILLSGLLLLAALPRTRRRFAISAGAAGALLFLAAALTAPNPVSVALASRYPDEKLLWRKEGVQTTVSVHQQPSGTRVLYLDGLHQANDSPKMVAYHRLIGHMAMALHPDPEQALVVGLGGGATPGAVSQHGGVQVDVVELSRTVAQGSDWLRHANYDVLRQPNVHLRIDDGRNYLLLTPKRYDVITADVIQPYHAGAGNVYSAEDFRLIRNALKDDGLMLQWNGGRYDSRYKLILRTFLSVFPHTTLWENGTLMVGTKRPLQLSRAAFERKLQDPTTRKVLESMDLGSFDALLAKYTAGPEEARRFVGPGPLLTDDRPMIEYFLSLPHDEPEVDLTNVRGDVMRHVRR